MTATPPPGELLQLRHVVVGYRKGSPLLPPITFTVRSGDLVGILGPNGAGKSTRLKTLLGLLVPLGGELGYPLGRPPRIGYVPQGARPDFAYPLSAFEVALMGRYGQVGLGRRPKRRFAQFLADLKARAPAWEAAAKPLAGMKVVTYHKSWSYVSKWLKLDESGYIENKPGIPPSPDHLAQLIVSMRAQGTKAILVESFYNKAIAEEVADKTGAMLLNMPSDVGATKDIKSYFDLVDGVLHEMARVH